MYPWLLWARCRHLFRALEIPAAWDPDSVEGRDDRQFIRPAEWLAREQMASPLSAANNTDYYRHGNARNSCRSALLCPPSGCSLACFSCPFDQTVES